MINKIFPDVAAALEGVEDGAVILVGGFGKVGVPEALIAGLAERNVRNLTIVANNAGAPFGGLPALMARGAIRKVVCSFPKGPEQTSFTELYRAGKIELELVPQGTLAERIRAASAGVPAFYTPTAAGTQLARGKETREIGGRLCVLEHALYGDVAFIEAWEADRWGNLTYRLAGRNFNPIMAGAAKLTIAQSQHVLPLGEIDPDRIVTPGIYVNRVVHVPYGDPIF
jgi:3-oxoadipate CoA-transferase alpha subunit